MVDCVYILFGDVWIDQLPTDSATICIMESEALTLDEILDSREENLDVAVWHDIGVQEFILKEDMAVVMVVTTPVVEGFSDAVSITSSRRPWGRGSIDLWRCHFFVNGS